MKPSRRARLICVLALLALAATASAENFLVFFGTYTNALSRGIYVARLNADTGKLSAPELAAETGSPCYLAVSPDGKFLYAANSVKNFSDYSIENGGGAVSAFAIDNTSGRLALLDQKCSGGAGPCHVSVDASGKVLFVANYNSGSVKAFLLETNGAIGAGGDCVSRVGHSVNASRQSSAHAHFICADPSNRFALACDLGTDEILVSPFDTATAGLHPALVEAFSVPPGSGARHLAFSRDGKFVHVINEIACTVTTFAWDSKNGKLDLVETISALPPEVPVQNSFAAAEILVHPDGKFVYATVRGHDSVSVFAADVRSGRLTFVQNISARGNVPRGLGLDPTGRWLIVANQKSDNAVEFAVDAQTGKLSPAGRALKIGSPVDVKFVKCGP
jgi:6-phosphogluconolactonase